MVNNPYCSHERSRRHDQEVRLLRNGTLSENQFFVSAIGRLISYEGTRNDRIAPYHSLHVIYSGEGKFQTRNREYSVRKGDVFLFSPGERYCYFDLPDRYWSYYWFILRGSGIDDIFSRIGLSAAAPYGQGMGMPLQIRLEEWFELLRKREDSFCFGHLLAWRILEQLSTSVKWSDPVPLGRRIREYIDVAGRVDVSVEEIADYFQLNRSTLFLAYKKEFGSGIKEYLMERRIHYAAELLRRSDEPLTAIAERCGFSSAQYLCRVIREHYGMTPDAFRRN